MIVNSLQALGRNATYQDLALRCQEFLHYYPQGPSDLSQLAEDVLYNALVDYMVQVGVPRSKAEHFCSDGDNLMELALRISSTLGPAIAA